MAKRLDKSTEIEPRASAATAAMHLNEQVDSLFALPLASFTTTRNALAGRLRKQGHVDDSARVKALEKPSIAAWTVNQLYWHHRAEFDRLLAAGERFRGAQAAQLRGESGDVRESLEARRSALSSLTHLADGLLREDHTPSSDTMRRITTTLEAVSILASTPDAPPLGRLTDDVDPPGFEALASLVPRVGDAMERGSTPTRVLAFQQHTPGGTAARHGANRASTDAGHHDSERRDAEHRALRAAAHAKMTEADRALREARERAARAEVALKQAAAAMKEAERVRVDAEASLAQTTAEAVKAKHRAREVAEDAERAAEAVGDAERAVEKAGREFAAIDEAQLQET